MDEVDHKVWLTHHPVPQEDGIWLRCRCGWRYHLGWMATPADAWFQEQEHRRDVAEKTPPEDIHYPMSHYYDRQGNPIDLMAWARLLEYGGNQVALTKIEDIKISTIWLGLDHSFGGRVPMIFETMIFGLEEGLDLHDEDVPMEYQWRYPSEIAALAGHDQAVALVREALIRREC